MSLTLFNTLTRTKEPFIPLNKKQVRLYTCGPTVYNYAHIGNLRAYIFEDILKRTLLFNKFKVKHIMNITDVGHLTSDADEGEDKMTKGLRREGLPLTIAGMKQLADKYTAAFNEDLQKLNILPPTIQPKASGHIREDIKFIKILKENGFTYKTSDGVYFDTTKLNDYGKLLGSTYETNEEHTRVSHSEKKHSRDFALWKYNPQLGWESPYGKGFPGWHIECSVMATKYLGQQFDIHCGGKEHIPVHHTNEIAQSEAAFNKKPWVKYWLHHEWLELGSEKMAKSGENFITLSTLQQKGLHPLDYRYFCLGTHYRNPLMFSCEAVEGAKIARKRLVDFIVAAQQRAKKNNPSLKHKFRKELTANPHYKNFTKEINDDLNTPKALAVMWDVVRNAVIDDYQILILLKEFDKILGLSLFKKEKKEKIPTEIIKLAEERLNARINKDWKKSDELRDKINSLGYIIGDTKKGYEIKKE